MRPKENAFRYVKRLAPEKWNIVAKHCDRNDIVVAADTTVILGKRIFGKPVDRADARRMLLRLSGRVHEVATAVAVGRANGIPAVRVVRTKVKFRDIEQSELIQYLKTKEWQGKAGAYAIQGAALQFVSDIRGSLSNVIGLPLDETLHLIRLSKSVRRSSKKA